MGASTIISKEQLEYLLINWCLSNLWLSLLTGEKTDAYLDCGYGRLSFSAEKIRREYKHPHDQTRFRC
jgi:hypothetical protein